MKKLALVRTGTVVLLFIALSTGSGASTNSVSAEPVDYRQLQSLAPASIGAFQRRYVAGGRDTSFDLAVTYADARYFNAQGACLRIRITDFVSLTGHNATNPTVNLLRRFWGVDPKKATESAPITIYQGLSIARTYNAETRSGEIRFTLADRFLVQISANGADPQDLDAALQALRLDRLKQLAASP